MSKLFNTEKNQGLSTESYNLFAFLIQGGFFRTNIDQGGEVKNNLRNETLNFGEMHCNLIFGMPILSYITTTHHNESLSDKRGEKGILTISYDQHTPFLKFLKARQRHTIKAVEEGIEHFIKYLNPEHQMTVNGQTFSMFKHLKLDTKARTLSFEFDTQFIKAVNRDRKPFTFVQIDELNEVKSNKTSGYLFLLTKSYGGLNKVKFLKKSYLAQLLGMDTNSNQKIDSAFKSLGDKGIVEVKKQISWFRNQAGKIVFWSKYIISKIKNTYKDTKKARKAKIKKQVVSKSVFNPQVSVEDREGLNPFYMICAEEKQKKTLI
ncbi:Replication initiation protein [Vibrio crassostreae]|nr:Replication initiation protein [Vibrio crassostreae]